jgi:predicted nucleic acid-binding protein
VLELTYTLHQDALDLSERHGFSVYDACIVAAGLHGQCEILYSENMQHGMVVKPLQKNQVPLSIRNPFPPIPFPSPFVS